MPNKSIRKIVVSVFAILVFQISSYAQVTHQNHESHNASGHNASGHNASGHNASGKPQSKVVSGSHANIPAATEGGQGAFTAIAEIVAILQTDPNTNWDNVNIDALREHLVDMNELAINASAKTEMDNGAVIFQVSATGRALKAVHAMVLAHSGVLNNITSWQTSAELTKTGATMTLRSGSSKELQKIEALGFFGVMATGAHHQKHHMLMARGAANIHKH